MAQIYFIKFKAQKFYLFLTIIKQRVLLRRILWKPVSGHGSFIYRILFLSICHWFVGADPCVRPATLTWRYRADTRVCPYGLNESVVWKLRK